MGTRRLRQAQSPKSPNSPLTEPVEVNTHKSITSILNPPQHSFPKPLQFLWQQPLFKKQFLKYFNKLQHSAEVLAIQIKNHIMLLMNDNHFIVSKDIGICNKLGVRTKSEF